MRKLVFANGEIYHVFNRGVEKRVVFINKRDYERATTTLNYYRFADLPLRLSKALILERNQRKEFFESIRNNEKISEILAYCLMPNHFHFLLKQKADGGVQKFIANFSNSYTKYFNTKYEKRAGPLLQGAFKAVHIEDDNQLVHVSRYIHLNPVTSFLIPKDKLDFYEWSSFPKYLGKKKDDVSDTKMILEYFKNRKAYRKFVHDQIDYAKKLGKIKHLTLESS